MEFRLEGVESEDIYELPLEEVEVLEQPLEEILGEVLGWKECIWCYRLLEEAWSRKNSEMFLELGGSQSLKNAKGV